MVSKAYNAVVNTMRKKGGSASVGTPQSGKTKKGPQVPPSDPQDNPKASMASRLADATAYAAATLGVSSSTKGPAVTTVNTSDSDDDGDKKMPAKSTSPTPKANTPPKLKDPPNRQGTPNTVTNRNVTVRVASTHTDATHDGLGTPWMPQAFGGGTPFSSTQSDIQFASQADTAQRNIPPNQPGTTSSSTTTNSFSTRDTAQQEDILLMGLNDLEDDPRDIMLFQMDEAISNVGVGHI